MKKSVLIFLLFLHVVGKTQNRSFLLKQSLPQYNNPAFVGTATTARLNYGFSGQAFLHKNRSLENYVGYDRHIKSLSGGVGIELYNRVFSQSGILTSSVALNYAYQYAISHKLTFSAGAGLYYKRQKTNLQNLLGPDVILDQPIYKVNYLDYKAGALLYNDVFYLQMNLGRYQHGGTLGSEKIYRDALGFGAGHKITLFKRRTLSVIPSFSYFISKNVRQLDLQAMFQITDFFIGANLEVGQNISIITGYAYGPFTIKVAGGFNINKLIVGTGPKADMVLQFNVGKRRRTSRGLILQTDHGKTIARNSNYFRLNLF